MPEFETKEACEQAYFKVWKNQFAYILYLIVIPCVQAP